jgi:putative heme iron utilization protein
VSELHGGVTDDPLAWRAPGAQGHSSGSSSPPTVAVVGADLPRSTPADAARTLVVGRSHGTLSTLTNGRPFGSVIGYGSDPHGTPLFVVSDIAEHTRNLRADPRCALLVTELTDGDPLAAGRVTLLGWAMPAADALPDATAGGVPGVPELMTLADFRLWRLSIDDVRWVGGFGEMAWLTVDDYRAATIDPILPHRQAVLTHMNSDHADAGVLLCAESLGAEVIGATMRHVDRFGYEYLATIADGLGVVRRNFAAPVTDVTGVRQQLIADVSKART